MSDGAPVRDAATVVLLRDGVTGLEVWLLTRAQALVFAGGMAVFPGGRVDDADSELPIAAEAARAVAERFGCADVLARALLGAALRETFEETGVLLASPSPDLLAHRADVEAGRVPFGDLVRAHGLTLDAVALHPWARWVTPAGEVRRYDTRFFLAALPAGASPQDVTSESSSAGWFGIGEALELVQRGELGMLPPTIVTLAALAAFGTVDEAIASAPLQRVDAISPDVDRRADGTFHARLPDGRTFELPRALFS